MAVNHLVGGSSPSRGAMKVWSPSTLRGALLFENTVRHSVYIIQSESTGGYYCGQTNDVERRIRQHNDPEYFLSRTTKVTAGPWRLVWSQECRDRSEAMVLERRIKKRGIGRYLKEVQSVESRRWRD